MKDMVTYCPISIGGAIIKKPEITGVDVDVEKLKPLGTVSRQGNDVAGVESAMETPQWKAHTISIQPNKPAIGQLKTRI